MRLDEYLDRDLVLPELASTTKPEVLREMTGAIAARHPHLDAELALSVLLDREGLGTTGIGDGVAIPHGKLPALENIIVLVARSKMGVDFDLLPCACAGADDRHPSANPCAHFAPDKRRILPQGLLRRA